MRRSAVVLVASFVFSSVASQPGQPLDCSDWVILEPGITCGWHLPPPDSPNPTSDLFSFGMSNPRVVDAQGRTIQARRVPSDPQPPPTDCGELWRTELVRWDGYTLSTIAYVDDRCEDGPYGKARACVTRYGGGDVDECRPGGGAMFLDLLFDLVNGRLLVGASSVSCALAGGCSSDYRYILSFGGFTTLFDVVESFAPATSGLGQRIPQLPEGLRAADRFDTYWGNVTKPLDLAQAHPLQCAYPDHQPQVGEYLTYLDTAPTPEPGQAIYYLTSVTYQGQTRAGRKALDSRLSGRDATSLPPCVPPSESAQGSAEPSRNSL